MTQALLQGQPPPVGAAGAHAKASGRDLQGASSLRHSALYCTPHARVGGTLAVSPRLLAFDPDPGEPHVREFGADLYEVRLELEDVVDCGAVTMPVEGGAGATEVAFYLQLHVKTLDGRRFCVQDVDTAWCVVFRMRQRAELYEAARLVLDAIARSREQPSARRQSHTSVPFPCLNCLSEMEAATNRQQRGRHLVGQSTTARGEEGLVASGGVAAARAGVLQALAIADVSLQPGNIEQPLLTQRLAQSLLDHLPIALRLPSVEWVLRYTPKAHGVSIATLFRNLADHEKTILLVQDTDEHLFGGFAPQPWELCPGRFYGSGEAFVFSFGTSHDPQLQVYSWTSKNSCFMYSDNDHIAMGGSDGHHAVVVRSDLLRGCSSPTLTFGNPTLAGSEEFVVRDLEIWAIEEVE